MKFLIIFLLISVEIGLGLCLNVNSKKYKLFKFDGKSFEFTSNFESMHLLKSYKANRQTFSIVTCLSLNHLNSSIKAITYEVVNDSTISFKSFSPPIIEFTDLMSTSIPGKLYLSNVISKKKFSLIV